MTDKLITFIISNLDKFEKTETIKFSDIISLNGSNNSFVKIPDNRGVYMVFLDGKPVYAGSAGADNGGTRTIRSRIKNFTRCTHSGAEKLQELLEIKYWKEFLYEHCALKCLSIENAAETKMMEAVMFTKFRSPFNGENIIDGVEIPKLKNEI